MITILNLIDDTNIGGVTRGVADLARRLGHDFAMTVISVATTWRLAPKLHADVVVIDFTLSWAKLAFLLSLRLRFRGAIIIVEHSYTAAYERECVTARGRFRALLRCCFRLAHHVVAVSEGQAAWMLQARLVHRSRLTCIPQSIGTEELAALPPARRKAGPLRLGAYGRYAPQKGFDTLIGAMRRVSPKVATLDLAGYGPDEAQLRIAAEGLPHVRIHGLTQPATFLRDVDCVVVPSRWEAYGLVAQEARAAGRPVIASAVDGLVEQVQVSGGLLVPPNDPVRLADAINRMADVDLDPLAAAARASTSGNILSKVEAWHRLLRMVANRPGPAIHDGCNTMIARAGQDVEHTPCQTRDPVN